MSSLLKPTPELVSEYHFFFTNYKLHSYPDIARQMERLIDNRIEGPSIFEVRDTEMTRMLQAVEDKHDHALLGENRIILPLKDNRGPPPFDLLTLHCEVERIYIRHAIRQGIALSEEEMRGAPDPSNMCLLTGGEIPEIVKPSSLQQLLENGARQGKPPIPSGALAHLRITHPELFIQSTRESTREHSNVSESVDAAE